MRWEIAVPPAAEPIDPDDARFYARVDDDTEDDLFERLSVAARQYFEKLVGISLIDRTMKAYLRFFPKNADIKLPLPPVSAVDSVVYNAAGTPTTLDTDLYALDNESRAGSLLLLPGASWPSDLLHPPGVTVTYTAGFGADGSAVPEEIVQALALLINHWYDNREAVLVQLDRGGTEPMLMPKGLDEVVAYWQEWAKR